MPDPPKGRPRPLPTPTSFTRPYWEAAKHGRFVLQSCRACGTSQYFPRPVCMRCMSRDLEWREASGRGVIYSFTITRLPPEGFEGREPYVIASVEVPEGTRIMTQIVGCAPEEVRIGMPVRATFERLNDDVALLQFEPAR